VSSVPAGVALKGLNYLKGRDDPLALKEEEYPEWLWRCLDVTKKGSDEDVFEGDEFCTYFLTIFCFCSLRNSIQHTGVIRRRLDPRLITILYS